jgi:RsiW-degrading membrane proteinase PrsW (M82 family)
MEKLERLHRGLERVGQVSRSPSDDEVVLAAIYACIVTTCVTLFFSLLCWVNLVLLEADLQTLPDLVYWLLVFYAILMLFIGFCEELCKALVWLANMNHWCQILHKRSQKFLL